LSVENGILGTTLYWAVVKVVVRNRINTTDIVCFMDIVFDENVTAYTQINRNGFYLF